MNIFSLSIANKNFVCTKIIQKSTNKFYVIKNKLKKRLPLKTIFFYILQVILIANTIKILKTNPITVSITNLPLSLQSNLNFTKKYLCKLNNVKAPTDE